MGIRHKMDREKKPITKKTPIRELLVNTRSAKRAIWVMGWLCFLEKVMKLKLKNTKAIATHFSEMTDLEIKSLTPYAPAISFISWGSFAETVFTMSVDTVQMARAFYSQSARDDLFARRYQILERFTSFSSDLVASTVEFESNLILAAPTFLLVSALDYLEEGRKIKKLKKSSSEIEKNLQENQQYIAFLQGIEQEVGDVHARSCMINGQLDVEALLYRRLSLLDDGQVVGSTGNNQSEQLDLSLQKKFLTRAINSVNCKDRECQFSLLTEINYVKNKNSILHSQKTLNQKLHEKNPLKCT